MRASKLWIAASAFVVAAPAFAVSLDLTTAGASGTLNGATYTQVTGPPSGTTNLGSFLLLQNSPTELGYNTGGGLPNDDKAGASFPSGGDISVSDFLKNNASILVDLNQSNGLTGGQIVLNSLQVYTSPTHDLVTGMGNLGTLQYAIGAGNQVLMNANLGTSKGDLNIVLPSGIFATASSTDAVYVFAQFVSSNAGPETFSLLANGGDFGTGGGGGSGTPPAVPEPFALISLPLALAGLFLRRRIAR